MLSVFVKGVWGGVCALRGSERGGGSWRKGRELGSWGKPKGFKGSWGGQLGEKGGSTLKFSPVEGGLGEAETANS
jgi:hypothetical protein